MGVNESVGCGEGSCKSGQTGAWDLHWQALAEKHDCALFAASYEQPQDADCQMWCDPRNGSAKAFQKSLADLGKASGHPELAEVPWALWGHSGGGHWVGGMTLLYPEKTIAVWHRSGVPLVEKNPDRPSIKTYTISDAAIDVPMMCNPGTEEGVTVKEGRFAGVWPANETFFREVRGKGGLIGIAVDPLTGGFAARAAEVAQVHQVRFLDHGAVLHRGLTVLIPTLVDTTQQVVQRRCACGASLDGGEHGESVVEHLQSEVELAQMKTGQGVLAGAGDTFLERFDRGQRLLSLQVMVLEQRQKDR